MPTTLSPAPAGGTSRANAPTVGLLSLSEPCPSAGYTDGVEVNGYMVGALAWWRFESFSEDKVQVWFDAMRTTGAGDTAVALVLFDHTGETIDSSWTGYDPVDGGVSRGAVLSPPLKLFDVIYVAIGQDEGLGVAPADYRLRVSGPSTLSEWIELPDRDQTQAAGGATAGNAAPMFALGQVDPNWPDPEMPYAPRPVYDEGFSDPQRSWSGHAHVLDLEKLSQPPWLPNYDGGGPYESIFKGNTGAYLCLQRTAMGPGKWNTQGDKWGNYWRNTCPPPLGTDSKVVGAGTSYTVQMTMAADHTAGIVTDPDSISLGYRCPVTTFNLHDAQEALGPSGGWLIQQDMLDQRWDSGLASEIEWEQDRCDILDVAVIRRKVSTSVFGYDKLDPELGSGIVAAPSASWRGGAAREPRSNELLWGPYIESLAGTPNAQFYYGTTVYGSSAGPGSMTRLGAVVLHGENPAMTVPDWREAYAFEEARPTTTFDSRGGATTRYHAPGLVYIATGDGFDQFGIDPSTTPAHDGFSLEIDIEGCRLDYQVAVRPSRFRFRDQPVIPAVTVTTDPPWVRALQRTDGMDAGGPPRAVQHTNLRSGLST